MWQGLVSSEGKERARENNDIFLHISVIPETRHSGQAEHLAWVQESVCRLPDQIVVKGEQSHECDPCSGSGSGPNYMGTECGVTAMAGIAVVS